MIFERAGRFISGIVTAAFLLTGVADLSAQHAIDTGRGLAMAPILSYAHTFNEPFRHLGLQIQGGWTRIDDYAYSLGPSSATVVEDHFPFGSFTALAMLYVDPSDIPVGIGLGYQQTALRTSVEYPGVRLWDPGEGDTLIGAVDYEARNSSGSIILDLWLSPAVARLGPGEIFLRGGLRNRLSLTQKRQEEIAVRAVDDGLLLVFDEPYPILTNGAGAIVDWSDEDDLGFDLALSVGLGWRMGFPREVKGSDGGSDSSEFDEFTFSDYATETYGPIVVIPTIDFYGVILGSHPIEQASWEVMVGVGFVFPW